MKYNIMGFNQKILVDKYNSLNGNDVIVLRVLVDIMPRMTRVIEVNKKIYNQVTYELLLEDIPFVTSSISALKKIVQKLINAGLIERYVLNKGGKFTYFRTTENLKELIYISGEQKKSNKSKKTNIDSNDQEPLNGQIIVEEILNVEDERVKIVKNTVNDGQVSKELMTVALKNNIEVIKDACTNVKERTNKINSKFLIMQLNMQK